MSIIASIGINDLTKTFRTSSGSLVMLDGLITFFQNSHIASTHTGRFHVKIMAAVLNFIFFRNVWLVLTSILLLSKIKGRPPLNE